MLSTFVFFETDQSSGQLLFHLKGDWVLKNFAAIEREIIQLQNTNSSPVYSLSQIGKLDTAGVAQITNLLGEEQTVKLASSLSSNRRALLMLLSKSSASDQKSVVNHSSNHLLIGFFNTIGKSVVQFAHTALELLEFIGMTLAAFGYIIFRPSRWRITSLVANIETCGLNAVPIVALLTFLVGAVISFLGLSLLNQFGAGIYTVSLVALAFLREFGVLLTAIIMAGRTASSFTAQIGAMKSNEEIDALKVSGLNPMEILVLPRVLAMLISLPALTFIAMMFGILGGMVVCLLKLNISTTMFFSLIVQNVSVTHFYLGLCKAPVFAFLIAIIGCMQGFKAGNSAASVGAHTTTSVVHSIFIVILLDALAALYFMVMGW